MIGRKIVYNEVRNQVSHHQVTVKPVASLAKTVDCSEAMSTTFKYDEVESVCSELKVIGRVTSVV